MSEREKALDAALRFCLPHAERIAATPKGLTMNAAAHRAALNAWVEKTEGSPPSPAPALAAGEHTPGPWHANESTGEISFADGDVQPGIAQVRCDNTSDGQFIADCRLIAAAPDMLAFIQRVAATKPVLASEADLLKGWLAMIAEAKAVVARATGREG